MHPNNQRELATDLRTVVTRLIKRLRKTSQTGMALSLTERSTLSLLDQQGSMFPNELASMEKITNQSMSQILQHLEALGYINRKVSKDDRRKFIISISARGTGVLRQVRNERDQWLSTAISQSCSADEVEILKKALAPLKRLVDFEGD